MKQRFSSLDVKVIAHELQQSLVTLRVANIYDLSSKILLFKFAKPDSKKQLVIDTGFRCHLTDFARTTATAPSAFVARLRKFLKTRRLTSVAQIGTDRILEFQFSDGQYRLFLEFFASGNIILTDANLNILTIARNVPEGDAQEPQRVGLQYSLDNRQNYSGIPPLTKERVREALSAAIHRAATVSDTRKMKAKPGGDLRKILAVSITEVPPVLVDHVLQENNFDTSAKPADILESEQLLDSLVESLSGARKVVEDITSSATSQGYIFAKRRPKDNAESGPSDETSKRENLLYEDFHPFVPKKLRDDPAFEVLEFTGYNKTVDEFFSSLEGQKLESRLAERELTAKRKLDAAKQDQAKRIEGLQEAQSLNIRKAAAIEANVERVQEALDAVNGLLAQGMDWVDIGKLIEREKKRRNPVAETIRLPLNLAENLITLSLSEEDFEDVDDDPFATDESESEGEDNEQQPQTGKSLPKALAVEINLSLSPWGNAREYYDQKRTAAVKQEKTAQQATRALKNAEQKITEDLRKGLKQEKALLQPIRRAMWFEKFTWFISSDGYLVLGGRDASQNEILYKRYLRKGDVYCHADLHGAASVVIKNNPKTPDAPIPPATLSQAGALSVCSSSAWDSKAGMGAWWVYADQVSKSAPTGEFLPAGSFMVRGKKNFLPPGPLLLGLGFMFKISEESKAKHVKHRLHESASSVESEEKGNGGNNDAGTTTLDDGDSASDEGYDSERQEVEERDNPLQSSTGGQEHEDSDEAAEEEPSLTEMDGLTIQGPDKVERPAEDQEQGGDEEEEEEEEGEEESGKLDESTVASDSQSKVQPTSGKQPAGSAGNAKPAKRGQRGKAKKIANKYKFQDEEDRAAAEALIGASAGQQRAEAEAKAKADREAELAAAKERRRVQHQRRQKEMAEHEEIRKVMMDEGLDVLDHDEAEQATALDTLIGTPLPGDEILEVVPVCAPWNALVKFKYKTKLQPGATKKGKAVKEILDRLKMASTKRGVVDDNARDSERMWPREVELLKSLKPEEVINCVPVGKVRVMLAGGTGAGAGGDGKGRSRGQGKGGRGGKGSKRS